MAGEVKPLHPRKNKTCDWAGGLNLLPTFPIFNSSFLPHRQQKAFDSDGARTLILVFDRIQWDNNGGSTQRKQPLLHVSIGGKMNNGTCILAAVFLTYLS
jgi:hypothetical protein